MKMNNETKIGIMISVVIVLLVGLTLKTGNFHLTRGGYRVKAHFRNIDGVNLNSPVMYNGFEVGIVEDIMIREGHNDTKMELMLKIDSKARLREGAKAYIKNLGFMGEKYVGLTSGKDGAAYLGPDSIIIGEEPPDFERLLAQGEEIAARLKSISQNIDERLAVNKDAVDETLKNLSITMKELSSIVQIANEHLGANEQKIDATVSNLHNLSVNLEELSHDLKLNPWKLLYREKGKKKTAEGKY
jgi:phospholipid/cholesterol/gamma-HCH transport system substrate-binding protein